MPEAAIFGILEIAGMYYFWPDFGTEVNYQTETIAPGESTVLFLEFDFPDIDDVMPFGPLRFWGAWYVTADRYGYDVAEFWLDREHRWTPTPAPTSTPESTNTPVAPTCTATLTGTPAETSTPTPSPIPTKFVYIPAGTFQMGSPDSELCRNAIEGPVHTVTLTHGFYIQRTEVTQQQWVDVFGNNPSYFVGMNRPVEQVTWFDCCIYCNHLSLEEGLMPCYYSDASYTTVFDGTPPVEIGIVFWNPEADGYRLPTEAEWENVCRAGTDTAYNSGQGNTDCSVDPNLDPLAWYMYNSNTGNGRESHPVGLKQANAWDLYDMHGNVWEWCWDWYNGNYYSSSPPVDPTGPPSGSFRVYRGGGWFIGAESCRSASRYSATPDQRNYALGFRVLKDSI